MAILNTYEFLKFPEDIEVYNFSIIGHEVAFTGYDLTNENDISGILTPDMLCINDITNDYQFEILQKLN